MNRRNIHEQLMRFQPVGIGGTCKLSRRQLAKSKIFVGDLPSEVYSLELFNLFTQFGPIREAVVLSDRFRTRSRCYGFVTFVKPKSAQTAMKAKIECDGHALTVKLAVMGATDRRADFFVKHGSSTGYRRLRGSRNKAVHCDPNLFRTANIQHIPAAKLSLSDNENPLRKRTAREKAQIFPNDDVAKDYAETKAKKVTTADRVDLDGKQCGHETPSPQSLTRAVQSYYSGFPETDPAKLTGFCNTTGRREGTQIVTPTWFPCTTPALLWSVNKNGPSWQHMNSAIIQQPPFDLRWMSPSPFAGVMDFSNNMPPLPSENGFRQTNELSFAPVVM